MKPLNTFGIQLIKHQKSPRLCGSFNFLLKSYIGFDDLIDLASKLPWWLAFILAAVSYIGLHQFAIIEVSTPKELQDMGNMAVQQLVKTLSVFGQYLLPAVFLLSVPRKPILTTVRPELVEEQVFDWLSPNGIQNSSAETLRRYSFSARKQKERGHLPERCSATLW